MMIFGSSSKSAAAAFLRSSPVTKRHGESRILRTHPLHLFRIIQNVDDYQDFLPLCKFSQVFPDTIQNNGRQFDAKLMVGKPPLFSEEYVSRVTVIPERLRIETKSISSSRHMFDSLKSSWQLRRIDGNDEDSEENYNRDKVLRDNTNKATPSNQLHSNISCHVDFEVEMTVSNPAVIAILDNVLMQVAGRQVEAFDRRCQELPWPKDLMEHAKIDG